ATFPSASAPSASAPSASAPSADPPLGDPPLGETGCIVATLAAPAGRVERQPHGEHRALPIGRLGLEGAPVGSHDFMGDVEAEAEATPPLGAGALDLIEAGEDVGQLGGRDAIAAIPHVDDGLPIL